MRSNRGQQRLYTLLLHSRMCTDARSSRGQFGLCAAACRDALLRVASLLLVSALAVLGQETLKHSGEPGRSVDSGGLPDLSDAQPATTSLRSVVNVRDLGGGWI